MEHLQRNNWEGRPNLAHLPYVFWYLGGLAIAFVQGFRIEFILIAYNRPRRWKSLIVGTIFGLAAALGLLSAAMFWLGVICGVAAVPLHFAIPQLAGYFLTGCMDVILSATVLTICRNSFVVVRALGTTGVTCDAKKATMVRRFMSLHRRLCAIELCVVVVFTSLFFYGTAFGGGYTWGRLSIMGPCLQNLFLLYSVECMKTAQKQDVGFSHFTTEEPEEVSLKGNDTPLARSTLVRKINRSGFLDSGELP
ncbi:hypothetical protein HDU89_003009 [Geranomyces variabilis]|nr:hypothetical protein HDU89_003009 [Geranomyces variabilis]